jgi:hypothetical protein
MNKPANIVLLIDNEPKIAALRRYIKSATENRIVVTGPLSVDVVTRTAAQDHFKVRVVGRGPTAPWPSHPQRSFSADLVIFVPRPKPLERRAGRQHIDIGVSPADNLHPDRQTVR